MNSKIIDIIIPAYNAHKTLVDTLFSIYYQNISDRVCVTIVNDASNDDYSDIIEKFKNLLNVRELEMEKNSGPGYARQYGIENTNAPFILFMDADDVLASPFATKDLLDSMTDETDLVISNFIKEKIDSKEVIEKSVVWLHGKLFRRSFLNNNCIQFIASRVNEDLAFNQLCMLKNARISYIDDVTYIWRYTENSITTKNNKEYTYKSVIGFAEVMTDTLELTFEENTDMDYFKQISYDLLLSIYYDYLFNYSKYDKQDRNKIINACKRINHFKNRFKYDNDYIEEKYKTYFDIYSEKYNSTYILNPLFTFKEFLDMLKGDKHD